jgi:hypothetical protein
MPLSGDLMEERQLHIIPNAAVTKAKFVQSLLHAESYEAHPETILAMKKNILLWDELLSSPIAPCPNCQELLHTDFWLHCPCCHGHL